MNKQLRHTILKAYLSIINSADMDYRYFERQKKAIRVLKKAIAQKKDISPSYEKEIRKLIFNLHEFVEEFSSL